MNHVVQTTSRERLLDAALDYVAEHGIGDISLRALAAALGTSHRMLIYHFGSRDELLLAVIRAAETREREAVVALDPHVTVADAIRINWRRVADPALWPQERLFFEVYGQALQGKPYAAPMLETVVDDWLGPVSALFEGRGLAPDAARAEARLGLAVVRGLLLDLLTTGDRAGADAAIERFAARYEDL